MNSEEAIKLGKVVWEKLPPVWSIKDELESQRLIGEAILAEREDHQETMKMYRQRRDAYDRLKEENKALLEALQNMTGMFGETVTRLQMGKGFTELHHEAVKSAKAAIAKYSEKPNNDAL